MTKKKNEWQTKKLATDFTEGIRATVPGSDFQSGQIKRIVQK